MNSREKMRAQLVTAVCLGLIIGPGSMAVAHGEALPEFTGEDYVVTASRIPTRLSETPANVTVITADMIAQNHYQDLAEVLRRVNGVVITEAAMSHQDIVRMDGDDRVAVLIDGRRMNMDKGAASGRAGIDLKTIGSLQNIERIEVVKGAGSALYGSDAVGGVINIITRHGKKVKNSSTLDMSLGSWKTKNVDYSNQGSEGDWSWFLTAGFEDQGNMNFKNWKTDRSDSMPNSDYNKKNMTLRLDRRLTADTSLTLNYEHVTDESGQWNQAPGYANHPHDRMDKLVNNIALTYNYKESQPAASYLRYYENYTTQGFHDIDGWSPAFSRYSNKVRGLDWQDHWQVGAQHLVGGLEWRETAVDNGAVNGGDYSDKKVTNQAAFLEDAIQLDKRWTLTPGLRADHHNMFGSQLTPKVAASYKADETTNFYASWGRVFNAPNTDDLFWHDPYGYMNGNPDLKPEHGYKISAGMNTKLSKITGLHMNVFTSKISDAIKWADNGSGIWQALNLNEEKKRGFEFTVDSAINNRWSADIGYSYIKTETNDMQHGYVWDENNSSPNGYRFGLHYKDARWNSNLFLNAGTGRSTRYFTDSSYWTIDLNTNYKMTEDLTAYIKVNNLFDKAYENTGKITPGAYPMGGRYLQVGVRYSF